MSTLRLAIVVTVVTSCFAMSISQNLPLCSLPSEEMVHKVLSFGTVSRDRLVLLGMQDTSLDLYTVQLNSTRLILPSSNLSLANTLGISPEFRRHKDSIMNSAVSYSNSSGYFLFSLNVREIEQPGIIDILLFKFNVTSGQLTRQDWNFNVALEGIDGEASVWISTMPPFLFVLLKDRYNGWLVAKVHINLKLRKFELSEKMMRLCMYGEPEQLYGVFLTDRGSHCKNPYDWPVVTGVHYNGQFYLFGEQQVHIFSDKVFQGFQQAEPHPISSPQYSSFIGCPSGTTKQVTFNKSQLAGNGTGPSLKNQSNRALCILILFLLCFALIIVCVIGCGRGSDNATPQQAPLKQQAFSEQHAEEAKLFLEETPKKSQIGGSIVRMERSRSRSGSRSHRRATTSLTGSKVGKAKSLVKGENSHQAKKPAFENPADFFADY